MASGRPTRATRATRAMRRITQEAQEEMPKLSTTAAPTIGRHHVKQKRQRQDQDQTMDEAAVDLVHEMHDKGQDEEKAEDKVQAEHKAKDKGQDEDKAKDKGQDEDKANDKGQDEEKAKNKVQDEDKTKDKGHGEDKAKDPGQGENKAKDRPKAQEEEQFMHGSITGHDEAQEKPDQKTAARQRRKPKQPTCNLSNTQLDELQDWLTRKPEIYDLKHPQHKNREHRNALFAAKAGEFGITVLQLKNRIKYIRDTVGRVNRHDKTGEGAKRITETDRMTYTNFKFLMSHIHTKPSRSTTKVADPNRRRLGSPLNALDDDDEDEDDDEMEEVEEEETHLQGEEAKESVGLAPAPRKKQKKTMKSKMEKEQSKILEEMKATMEQGSTVRAEIQTMLGVGDGQNSPRSRERRSFGHYLCSVLPTIHDTLWLDFRSEVNKILDNYQRKSKDLERAPVRPQPQLAARTHQAQLGTSLNQQQVVAHQLQQNFEASCSQSPVRMGLAQWQHQYQRPEQTYLFPEAQTTFTPQQMAMFDQPRSKAPAALGAPPVHPRMVRIHRPPILQTLVGSSSTATGSTAPTFDMPQVPLGFPEVSRCSSVPITLASDDFLSFVPPAAELNLSQQDGDTKSTDSSLTCIVTSDL